LRCVRPALTVRRRVARTAATHRCSRSRGLRPMATA
jgi:hypothetical protein